MESAVLPDWEMSLYWILSFTAHLYSFYQLHLFSKEHEESLDGEGQLEQGSIIRGSKKVPELLKTSQDAVDFEWSFWSEWAWRSLLWSLIGHAVVSQLTCVCMPQLRKAVLTVYGVLCAWWLLGLRGVAVLMLQLTVSLAVAQVRSPALSWGCSLILLSTLHISSVQDIQRCWYDSNDKHYLLMFSTAMCVLRCVSFSLELCWSPLPDKPTNHSFSFQNLRTFLLQIYDLVTYCFYHPLFYNGPVLNYNHFKLQLESSVYKVPLVLVLCGTLRVCMWWCLAELMIHFMYMHSIQNNETFLNMLPPWALGGLALALVQFFYVKYLVLFGVASLLMKLDGIEPPPLPRCVSTMYSFRGMWRHFDVGLYRWLIRYVYVPLGGSQHGLFQKLISMAMAFGFVCLWHGCHDYLQCWALLNWVCVFMENGITHILSWPPLQHTIVGYVSLPMRRRGLALVSAFSTALLILSNLVFLAGVHIGRVYWEKVFMQGWSSMLLPVLGCLYCFAQVGLEMDRKSILPRYDRDGVRQMG